MADELKSITEDVKKDNKKPLKRWTKSIRIGEDTTEIEVKEISNGYLIRKSRNYKTKDGWQYDDVEEFSKTNPLEEDGDAKEGGSIKEMYEGLFGVGESLT